ncbi:MAG: hypothetical protein JNL58_08400 [Planctomyces sp.]|nr:hypothetical protein [Planctomyces sp.]
MNTGFIPRGRILTRQQVRVSDAPVRLDSQASCSSGQAAKVTLETDPVTGEVTEIHVHCACGEVTILECRYDD